MHAAEHGVEWSASEFGNLAEGDFGAEAQDEDFAFGIGKFGDGFLQAREVIALNGNSAGWFLGGGKELEGVLRIGAATAFAAQERDGNIVGNAEEPGPELILLAVVREGAKGAIVSFLQGVFSIVVSRKKSAQVVEEGLPTRREGIGTLDARLPPRLPP